MDFHLKRKVPEGPLLINSAATFLNDLFVASHVHLLSERS